MPESTSQFSGLLGGPIESLFGSNKPPRPIYRDEAIRNYERELTAALNSARAGLPGVLSEYTRGLARTNPLMGQAVRETNNALSGILGRTSSPLSEAKDLGNYLFEKVQSTPDSVLNYLSNAQNLSNLARGLSPGAASSYEQILRGGLAQRSALEANRAALSGLTGLYPVLQNSILNRDAALLNIFPARQQAISALENRALLPYQAQLASLADLQRLGLGQNALDVGNLQGYQPVKNWANRVGDMGRSIGTNISQLLDWASQAASIYSGGLGGGMGGGGGGLGSLGGLFGGGGNAAAPSTYYGPSMAERGAGMLNSRAYPVGTYMGDIPGTNYYS